MESEEAQGQAEESGKQSLEAQVARLEEELATERRRSADKDQKIEMLQSVVTRLQSRVELLEDNLKEQQRRNRIMKGSGEAVLELQQQLAEELSKRKQAQYELIAKAKELCDVQQKIAENHLSAHSAQDLRNLNNEARKELPRGAHMSWSPASSQSRPANMASPATAPCSPALVPHSAPAKSPVHPSTTPRSSGRTSPSLPSGEAMADRVQNQRRSPVVPALRIQSESVVVRPPLEEESLQALTPVRWVKHDASDAFFFSDGPAVPCHSGHATPVSPAVFSNVPLDYPRILTTRNEMRTGPSIAGIAAAAKSARVISPPLSARMMGPLVLPAAQSVVVCEGIHF